MNKHTYVSSEDSFGMFLLISVIYIIIAVMIGLALDGAFNFDFFSRSTVDNRVQKQTVINHNSSKENLKFVESLK